MKWTLLLNLILIGLVAGDGAWKGNYEYKYKLTARALSEVNNQWVGAVSRARLVIQPQSENLLIGKISEAESAEVELSRKWDSDLNDNELSYNQWPLSKPFEIHLKNGRVHSMSVDRAMTYDQINQLKSIVSQFQVDISGQNEIDNDTNDAFYKTTESTFTGNCENIYDISPLPEYLAEPEWVPVPELKGDGEFFKVVKTRNFGNCSERFELLNGPSTNLEMDDSLSHNEVTFVTLYGSLKSYTIQSSVTTNKVVAYDRQRTMTVSYVKLTLESMERSTRRPQIQSDNLKDIGNLNYYNNSPYNLQNSARPMYTSNDKTQLSNGPRDNPIRWSTCYTGFTTVGEMCLKDNGPEWKDIESSISCGILYLGKKVKCQLNFAGCEAGYCYSPILSDRCKKEFGDRLPIAKGWFQDCFIGFVRDRCCPKSYE